MAAVALSLVEPTKGCTVCKQQLPRSSFYKTRYKGLRPKCKKCESRHTNLACQQRIRTDWITRMLKYARCNRLKRGGKHERTDLDREFLYQLYVEQDGRCGWTGVRLSLEEMGKPWSVSLDRLDCDRGYVKGNVMLTSRAANLARNNSTTAEMEAFVQMIKEA